MVGAAAPPCGAELGQPESALAIAIGRWLLNRASPPTGVAVDEVTVAGSAPAADCARLGAELAARAGRLALLVCGDGSACRTPKAPGYFDPRAEAFDAASAQALAAADPAALLALDAALAEELLCAGRAPWQVLAGAAAAGTRQWRGEVRYEAAPYGVAYFVATWSPA